MELDLTEEEASGFMERLVKRRPSNPELARSASAPVLRATSALAGKQASKQATATKLRSRSPALYNFYKP